MPYDITQRDSSLDVRPVCVAEDQKAGPQKKRKHVRAAAGDVWVDPTLDEWPDSTCLHIPVSLVLFLLVCVAQHRAMVIRACIDLRFVWMAPLVR